MHTRHHKKHYVSGLISLIGIPILLLVSTSGVRKQACCSIEAQPEFGGDPAISFSKPETLYVFRGDNEIIKLERFNEFCKSMKLKDKIIITVNLPERCNYDLFIQVIDILQLNDYLSYISHRKIYGYYRPDLNFSREIVAPNALDEVQYLYSVLVKKITLIKYYFVGEPERDRTIRYSELAPPSPLSTNAIGFPMPQKIKEEPMCEILLSDTSSWSIYIIISWLFLLLLLLGLFNKSNRNNVHFESIHSGQSDSEKTGGEAP
jgi:hypothetical protein